MKKTMMMTAMAIIGMCVLASAVSAGPKKKCRWEGDDEYVETSRKGTDVRIYASLADDRKGKTCRAPDVERVRRYPKRPHRQRGHWETRKIWIPAEYEKVWNPGHYNRRHKWVKGHWIEIETRPGYWKTETYWVSHRRY